MQDIVQEEHLSHARACRIIKLDRSMYYYQAHPRDNTAVEAKLRELAEKLPTRGFDEYFKRIRQEELVWNHKRVKSVYLKLGLNRRRKTKRRLPLAEKQPLVQPIRPNLTWSMDFMHDVLENGRKFRTLNIIDDYNREALCIAVGYSFPSEEVVRIVGQLCEWRGRPEQIRPDNGSEFIAQAFQDFCGDKIEHIKIQKGKPTQNGYIERFNRTFREDVLDAHIFRSLAEVEQESERWSEDYNANHPHASLGDRSPWKFMVVNCGKHPYSKAS